MAIRQKTTISAKIDGACPSHSMTNCTVRDVDLLIDEPFERGGTTTALIVEV